MFSSMISSWLLREREGGVSIYELLNMIHLYSIPKSCTLKDRSIEKLVNSSRISSQLITMKHRMGWEVPVVDCRGNFLCIKNCIS